MSQGSRQKKQAVMTSKWRMVYQIPTLKVILSFSSSWTFNKNNVTVGKSNDIWEVWMHSILVPANTKIFLCSLKILCKLVNFTICLDIFHIYFVSFSSQVLQCPIKTWVGKMPRAKIECQGHKQLHFLSIIQDFTTSLFIYFLW